MRFCQVERPTMSSCRLGPKCSGILPIFPTIYYIARSSKNFSTEINFRRTFCWFTEVGDPWGLESRDWVLTSGVSAARTKLTPAIGLGEKRWERQCRLSAVARVIFYESTNETCTYFFYSYSCFLKIARTPSKMVAKTASIIDGGRTYNTNRLITSISTTK